MRCAYVTMDDLGDYVSDADLSVLPMQDLGWRIDKVSWRATDVDWNVYDLAYLCTPWDYHEDLGAFLDWIDRVDACRCVLANPADTVRWNADKHYLRDVAALGHAIVPSLYFEDFDLDAVLHAFSRLGTYRMVIKPTVGASAADTFVLEPNSVDGEALAKLFSGRPFFLQPFIDSVQETGEYSLFFFDGDYSHAILKTPKSGDFRTQEEHGSDIQSVEVHASMVNRARELLATLEPAVAYARVDYVSGDRNELLLMELELIEPSLYFRTSEGSARRFAEAMTRYYERLRP